MSLRADRVLVHPLVQASYDDLEAVARSGHRPETSIWKSMQHAFGRIRTDLTWGEVISRTSIPAYFVQKYGATNLYCIDLASFERAFYTIVGRTAILLDIVDHRRYDRLFRARRSR